MKGKLKKIKSRKKAKWEMIKKIISGDKLFLIVFDPGEPIYFYGTEMKASTPNILVKVAKDIHEYMIETGRQQAILLNAEDILYGEGEDEQDPSD